MGGATHHLLQIKGRTAPYPACASFLAAKPTCANASVAMSVNPSSWLLEPVARKPGLFSIRAAVRAAVCVS